MNPMPKYTKISPEIWPCVLDAKRYENLTWALAMWAICQKIRKSHLWFIWPHELDVIRNENLTGTLATWARCQKIRKPHMRFGHMSLMPIDKKISHKFWPLELILIDYGYGV
jgi:hypothetical protein